MRYPIKCCSIIADGADPSAFSFSHFTPMTEDVIGNALKVRLAGALEHRAPKHRVSLFTLAEKFQTGANYIIETLHRLSVVKETKVFFPISYIRKRKIVPGKI